MATLSLLAGLILASTPRTAGANSILNGGFESGTWGAWTATPAPSGSLLFIGGHAESGRDAAWFGAIGGLDDQLSQSFETDPGHGYILDFWLGHGRSITNDFSVWWNDNLIMSVVNAPRFSYTEYSLHVFAGGPLTTLRFSGRDLQDYYYLDNVSVTANPEPTTLILLTSGLIGLAYRRRRAACSWATRSLHL